MNSIGTLIKEERERLGMSQTELGVLLDAGRTTVIAWESGKTSPTAVQLAALADAGADVLYILTGERRLGDVKMALTEREAALVNHYRRATDPQKAALDLVGAAFAQSPDPCCDP